MKLVWSVGRVASWDGFCLPCDRDDRPLVLTRSGATGLRAWLAGIDDDERALVLTCRVCGEWQDVPRLEEDDPEVVVPFEHVPDPETPVDLARVDLGARPAATATAVRPVLTAARLDALQSIAVPAPRVHPEAVAAARSVLSAARASAPDGGTRTSATRTSAATHPGSRRRGPTPRRPDTTRTARPTTAPVAEARSIVLPAAH